MKPYFPLRNTIFLALILLIFGISCEKSPNTPEPTPEEIASKQLEEYADYNNSVLQGAGNIYLENQLTAGSPSQLLAKQVYQQDTLSYFASTNSSSAVETLHTISYTAKSTQSRLINEVVPEQQLVRIYSIDKGIKNKLVFSLQAHSDQDIELRLLEHNWGDNTAKVIMSLLIRNGVRVAKYTAPIKTMGLSANATNALNEFTCTKPTANTNTAAALDEQTAYFQCLYQEVLTEHIFRMMLANLESGGIDADAIDIVRRYEAGAIKLYDVLGSLAGTFTALKSSPIAADEPYKSLQSLYQQTRPENTHTLKFNYVAEASNLTWDDSDTTKQIKLTLAVIDAESNKPKLGIPAYVDVRLMKDSTLLREETLATDPETGRITFLYNPENAGLHPADQLTIVYQSSAGNWQGAQQQSIKIVDNLPAKITIVSGNNQEGDWQTLIPLPLKVKVTTEGGKALANIVVRWETTSGSLSQYESLTDAQGIAETRWTTGLDRYEPGELTASVIIGKDYPREEASARFQYMQKKLNFSLGIVEFFDDKFHNDDGNKRVTKIWKNGDKITVYNNVQYHYRLLLDGKELKYPDGRLMEFGLNSSTIGVPPGKFQPFQAKDVHVPSYTYYFPNPANGRTDSIKLDVTISNEMYRRVVGKTLRVEGSSQPAKPGWVENQNVGEVVTYTFNANGKVTFTSLKNPKTSGTFDYGPHLTYTEVPTTTCDDKMTMRKVIGLLTLPVHNGLPGLYIYDNFSLGILNSGVAANECAFGMYWQNMTLK